MIMYHFKEVILQNGPHKRKSLIIEFDDPNMRIIGEFLMADAPLLGGQVLQEIDQVLAREKTTITSNGNRCSLKIANPKSVVSDLLEGKIGRASCRGGTWRTVVRVSTRRWDDGPHRDL